MVKIRIKTSNGDINITISKGKVNEDYVGFKGKTCKITANKLSLKSKIKTEEEELKPEYFEAEEHEAILT